MILLTKIVKDFLHDQTKTMRFTTYYFIFLFVFATCFLANSNKAHALILSSKFIIPNDSISKDKLIKKILKTFDFRKNLREKEEKRIIAIINKIIAGDSLGRKVLALKNGNQELEKKLNDRYNSLLLSIKQLSVSINKISQLTDKEDQQQEEIKIDDLVKKISPIIKQQLDDENHIEDQDQQLDRLKQIRWLLAHGTKLDTVKLNDSTSKVSTIQLKKRAELFGYHRVWMTDNYLHYRFKLISTLAFYAYELNVSTGGYKSLNGWDTSKAITAAQKEGCQIALVVTNKSTGSINTFLKNRSAQKNLVTTVTEVLQRRNANGVNIMFDGLNEQSKNQFVYFISLLSKSLKTINPSYKLSVTVPAYDEWMAYHISALEPYVDKFIIDFTKKEGDGPIAPLKGTEYSIKESLDRYLNQNLPADKIITCLPYYGLLCHTDPSMESEYISYSRIKSDYADMNPVYEKQSATARIDDVYEETDTIQKIWYDDERTLQEKYDYILQNDINGLGVWCLGYDAGHEELWNLLMDKVFTLDTIHVKLISTAPVKPAKLSFFDVLKKEASLYVLMLKEPCKVNLKELRSDDLIGKVTLVFIILLGIVCFIFTYKLRYEGDSWKWKKVTLRLLIFLVLIVFMCVFMCFFLNRNFPLVGITNDARNCSPVPFGKVIFIISIGFVFGLCIMKYLIQPFTNKDEKP